MDLYRVYGARAGRAGTFVLLAVLLRWLSGATEAKTPEPIIVDDEFVDHGDSNPCAYRFKHRRHRYLLMRQKLMCHLSLTASSGFD